MYEIILDNPNKIKSLDNKGILVTNKINLLYE